MHLLAGLIGHERPYVAALRMALQDWVLTLRFDG
jgi:hypothetical protein